MTAAETKIGELVKNLESMLYNDYHIHAGVEREVITKRQEKNGQDRTYLFIRCYSLAGTYKGQYKCGYVIMDDGNYVNEKWDDVNAETKDYIGR